MHAADDAAVSGVAPEGQGGVGLMLFLDPKACLRLGDPAGTRRR